VNARKNAVRVHRRQLHVGGAAGGAGGGGGDGGGDPAAAALGPECVTALPDGPALDQQTRPKIGNAPSR